MIVTFYSFKGGVGRSMALANCAEILVEQGYEVIVVDWDLEAPGLERYLTSKPDEVAELRRRPGVIELLAEYRDSVARPAAGEGSETPPDPDFYRVGGIDLRRPSSYARSVGRISNSGGTLRFLPAGNRAGDAEATFIKRVEELDWTEFYDRWSGASYMEFFRRELVGELMPGGGEREGRRIVLIDARTGFTEHGGVCTHHLADLVVVLFGANELNVEGAEWITKTLSDPRLVEDRGGRSLGVIPVPSRVEQFAQKEELQRFRAKVDQRLEGYLPESLRAKSSVSTFLELEIPYVPYYSFEERVVAREAPRDRDPKLHAAYVAVSTAIVAYGAAHELVKAASPQTESAAGVPFLESLRDWHRSNRADPGPRLDGGRLEGLKLPMESFDDTSLRGAIVRRNKLTSSSFSRADLHGSDWRENEADDVWFDDANLADARFEACNLTRARFERADLRGAHLEDCLLKHARFDGARLEGATIRRCHDVDVAAFQGAHLDGLTSDLDFESEVVAAAGRFRISAAFALIAFVVVGYAIYKHTQIAPLLLELDRPVSFLWYEGAARTTLRLLFGAATLSSLAAAVMYADALRRHARLPRTLPGGTTTDVDLRQRMVAWMRGIVPPRSSSRATPPVRGDRGSRPGPTPRVAEAIAYRTTAWLVLLSVPVVPALLLLTGVLRTSSDAWPLLTMAVPVLAVGSLIVLEPFSFLRGRALLQGVSVLFVIVASCGVMFGAVPVSPAGPHYMDARLEGVDLSGADLDQYEFRGGELRGVSFDRASLEHAVFVGSDLRESSFSAATLRGATFEDAQLDGSSFRGADLTGATFRSLTLRDVQLGGANLTNVQLDGVDASGAVGLSTELSAACAVRTVFPPRIAPPACELVRLFDARRPELEAIGVSPAGSTVSWYDGYDIRTWAPSAAREQDDVRVPVSEQITETAIADGHLAWLSSEGLVTWLPARGAEVSRTLPAEAHVLGFIAGPEATVLVTWEPTRVVAHLLTGGSMREAAVHRTTSPVRGVQLEGSTVIVTFEIGAAILAWQEGRFEATDFSADVTGSLLIAAARVEEGGRPAYDTLWYLRSRGELFWMRSGSSGQWTAPCLNPFPDGEQLAGVRIVVTAPRDRSEQGSAVVWSSQSVYFLHVERGSFGLQCAARSSTGYRPSGRIAEVLAIPPDLAVVSSSDGVAVVRPSGGEATMLALGPHRRLWGLDDRRFLAFVEPAGFRVYRVPELPSPSPAPQAEDRLRWIGAWCQRNVDWGFLHCWHEFDDRARCEQNAGRNMSPCVPRPSTFHCFDFVRTDDYRGRHCFIAEDECMRHREDFGRGDTIATTSACIERRDPGRD